jgi:hypothetical protein
MLLKVKIQMNSSLQFLRRFSARPTLHQQLTDGPDLETRANMESRIIAQRAFQFACRIVKLCEWLRQQGWTGRKIADQLFDSGTRSAPIRRSRRADRPSQTLLPDWP